MNVLDLNAMHGKEMLDIICGGVKRETSTYNKFSFMLYLTNIPRYINN